MATDAETQVSVPLTDICHCSLCRKYSGVHGVAVVLFPTKAFRWLRGEDQISTWKRPGGNWRSWFCKTCGSPLPGGNDEAGEQMFAHAGVFDEGVDDLTVAHHLWTDSKAPWDQICDGGKRHPKGYGS